MKLWKTMRKNKNIPTHVTRLDIFVKKKQKGHWGTGENPLFGGADRKKGSRRGFFAHLTRRQIEQRPKEHVRSEFSESLRKMGNKTGF